MAAAKHKKNEYKYVDLNSLRPQTKADVYGVIKFIKPAHKTRGTDYSMILSIVDQSILPENKLKCLLFHKQENHLPVGEVGDVIRFHRLNISEFNGELQGQSGPGYSWLLFKGDSAEPIEPYKASSSNYAVTDTDRQKVYDLRRWAADSNNLNCKLTTFSEMAAGSYLNILAQVVTVQVLEENVCLLLRVWDGTKSLYPVRLVGTESVTLSPATDEFLHRQALGFIHDICLFDNHVRPGLSIEPGNFIRIVNLHAAVVKTTNMSENRLGLPTLELVVHRGSSYGRRCEVLTDDHPKVKDLQERLKNVVPEPSIADEDSRESYYSFDSDITPILLGSSKNQQESDEVVLVVSRPCEEYDNSASVSKKGGKLSNQQTTRSVIDKTVPHTGKENRNSETQNQANICDKQNSQGKISKEREINIKGSNSTNENSKKDAVELSSSEPLQCGQEIANRQSLLEDSGHWNVNTLSSQSYNVSLDENLENSNDNVTSKNTEYPAGSDQAKRCRFSNSNNRNSSEEQISTAQSTDKNVSGSVATSSLPTCMLKTCTVLQHHPQVGRCKISEILEREARKEVPNKYLIQAKVADYYPKAVNPRSFLQLLCPICHYLCSLSDAVVSESNDLSGSSSQLQLGSSFKGVPHYICPRCEASKQSYEGADSPPHLQYIYMMRLVLQDSSSQLLVNMWQSDAEKFFQDIQPEDILLHKEHFQTVQDCLNTVCPPDVSTSDRPYMECCIKSYSTKQGIRYQLFNTVAVL